MKPIIRIIREELPHEEGLIKDLDYELSSLFLAIINDNKKEIDKSKKRLEEIRKELIELGVLYDV